MAEFLVNVTPQGRLVFLWDDRLAGLRDLGRVQLRRASHVEPTADGRWTADLSPIGGPLLGPFDLRGDALDAEKRAVEQLVLGAESHAG